MLQQLLFWTIAESAPLALPEGELSGVWFGASVSEDFAVPHPTRLAPGHLPPRGKALVRGNLVGTEGNPRWRRGHAPALRTRITCAFVHRHVTNRVTPLRWWFTARVTVSNRQRRHAARVTT